MSRNRKQSHYMFGQQNECGYYGVLLDYKMLQKGFHYEIYKRNLKEVSKNLEADQLFS